MSMEELARREIQARSESADARAAGLTDWQHKTMNDLEPVFSEYAQALARLKFRPDETRWKPWFEPSLVLVDRDHQDGYVRATCRFAVHDSGTWSWVEEPRWHSTYDFRYVPVNVESIRATLINTLSGAIEAAVVD